MPCRDIQYCVRIRNAFQKRSNGVQNVVRRNVPVLDRKGRRISWFTDLSWRPNRPLDLIIAGQVDSGIWKYSLRTSDSPDHGFLNFKANCRVDSLSLVKLSFAKLPASYAYMLECVLCLHAEMRPRQKWICLMYARNCNWMRYVMCFLFKIHALASPDQLSSPMVRPHALIIEKNIIH